MKAHSINHTKLTITIIYLLDLEGKLWNESLLKHVLRIGNLYIKDINLQEICVCILRLKPHLVCLSVFNYKPKYDDSGAQ